MFPHLKIGINFLGLLFILNRCDSRPESPGSGYPIRILFPDDNLFIRSEQECVKYTSVYQNCVARPSNVNEPIVTEGEIPFVAALGIRKNNNGYMNWKCAGTLVAPKYVLSSAFCFFLSPGINHVSLGDLDHSTTTDNAHRQDFSIEKRIIHPDNEEFGIYNDITLVVLNGTAQLNRFVMPACLSRSNERKYTEFLKAGWTAVSSDGEIQDLLMKTPLELFPHEECELEFLNDVFNDKGLVERMQICARTRGDRNEPCAVDRGGPLFVQHPRYPCLSIVVGLESDKWGCGRPGVTGIYTRIQDYVPWLERILWPNEGTTRV